MAKFPPLPEPDTHCWDDDTQKDCWSHSPNQLRARDLEIWRMAMEEAAKACDSFGESLDPHKWPSCVAASEFIRALPEPSHD